MKQLITHNIRVKFINNFNNVSRVEYFDAANIRQSRHYGREIAKWLVRGNGFKVESETIHIKYSEYVSNMNLTAEQREQAHTAKIRQMQDDGA